MVKNCLQRVLARVIFVFRILAIFAKSLLERSGGKAEHEEIYGTFWTRDFGSISNPGTGLC